LFGHEFGRAHLLEADFGMAVNIPAERNEFGLLALLWQFRFGEFHEEFLTVRASPG